MAHRLNLWRAVVGAGQPWQRRVRSSPNDSRLVTLAGLAFLYSALRFVEAYQAAVR